MSSLFGNVKKVLLVPDESPNVEKWKVISLWILRVIVIGISVHSLIWGEHGMGFMTLFMAISAVSPHLVTRGKIKDFPVEIELMLFIIVFVQYVLGELLDLYYSTPYFDKFAHFSMSFMIAAIIYTIIFAMYKRGKFQASRMTIFLIILLISMGIGGIWEVVEYALEFLRKTYFTNWVVFQGSLVEDAYHDTMNDLVADFIGAILGSIFTLKYIISDVNNSRTQELVKDIDEKMLK